jgi:hypothetical protein
MKKGNGVGRKRVSIEPGDTCRILKSISTHILTSFGKREHIERKKKEGKKGGEKEPQLHI